MRIFIAINFISAIKDEISQLIDLLENQNYHGYRTAHDNLHMTLHYLGETKINIIQEIINQLKELDLPSFLIRTDHFKFFDKGKSNKIMYLGIEENKDLYHLHDHIIGSLNKLGYMIDKRGYTPHITLLKHVHIENQHTIRIDVKSLTIMVDSVSVMESKKMNGKLIYSPIANIKLKK
ncbi:RNA 2',3'-cyclic phosphodiesterase [Mycoplasmatota bacterium]|nr:RNA 2',3'-cyclic phosphodiesterase [Mycoplasmatota bacterium]